VSFSQAKIKKETWTRWYVSSCYSHNTESAYAISSIWNIEV